MENKQYSLFTAIAMIIGICIGSGIFFKSDNILIATGGNILLGIVVFALGAISIIFGGLCISELSSRTDRAGGIITYAGDYIGKAMSCGFGWFQVFIYFPTISIVVSWAVGIYVCILFNLPHSFELQMLIGIVFFTICFIYNVLSKKLGGIIQNASTVIKLIPIALIAILGLIFRSPILGFSNILPSAFKSFTWISAVAPIAFSYDGWIVSTSIAHEIKDSKKNLSKALIIGPLFVFFAYVLYFIGVSFCLNPNTIMELGDKHVSLIATNLFGNIGSKIIIIFVIISVMGTVNGLVLGFIRMPYSLAIRGNMIPFNKSLCIENKKFDMPINSAVFAYIITLIWASIHYFMTKYNMLLNSDVSEISITTSYLLYIILYFKVFKLYKSGEIKSKFKGVLFPLLATIGALFIVFGGMQSVFFVYYSAFCILTVFLAYSYYKKNNK